MLDIRLCGGARRSAIHKTCFCAAWLFIGLLPTGRALYAQGSPDPNAISAARPVARKEMDSQEPISTDRPDFTESTEVVGPGVVQWEGGFTFERERDHVGMTTGPYPLLRVGVGRTLEVRVASDGLKFSRSGGTPSGMADQEVSLKVRLAEAGKYRPSFAILGRLSLPYGSTGYSSRGYDPGVTLAWGRDLKSGFEVSGNFNFDNVTANGKRTLQNGESLSIARHVNRRWGTYCEVYTISEPEIPGARDWVLNGGVTRNYGNVQLDAEAGRALTAHGPVWFFGVGFAYHRTIMPR